MNVRLSKQFKVTAMSWTQDLGLISHQYTIDLYLDTVTEDGIEQNIGFARIHYLLTELIRDAVFINVEHADVARAFYELGAITVAEVPFEPHEQVIGAMLHAKVTAICEGRYVVNDLNISSSSSDGVVYYHNASETLEGETPVEDAWWNDPSMRVSNSRPDPSMEVGDVGELHFDQSQDWSKVDLEWPAEPTDDDDDDNNNLIFVSFDDAD